MVCVPSGSRAITVEFDLKLRLLPRHQFTAHRAGDAAARSAVRAVRLSGLQPAGLHRFVGLGPEEALVLHLPGLVVWWLIILPKKNVKESLADWWIGRKTLSDCAPEALSCRVDICLGR